jgi:hypothetical protein
MIIARQSTARTVTVGPVLDADGVAVTDGVVGDFKVSKNGAAPAALNGSATLTHRNTGHYSLALTASDLDTVGSAEIVIDDTVNACPMKEITVMEEATYDALFAASANAFTGAAGSTTLTALATGSITAAVIATGAIDADAIADNAIDAGALAADCITAAKIADGAIDAATFAAGAITAAAIAADAIGASELAADAASEIATAVTAALGTGSGLTALATQASVNTIDDFLDTEITTIITHLTDIKGATFSGATDSLEAIRDRGDAAWLTATGFSTHSAADVVTALGTGSSLTALATAANLATVAGYLDTEIAAILEDTGTTLPAQIAALSFSTLDAAGVRAAVGLASANLDTQLGDLPTAGEVAAEVPTAAENADALLGRRINGGADGGRTVGQALAASRNRVTRSGDTLTVYDVDDVTPLWTATITTDAGADLLTGVDPA